MKGVQRFWNIYYPTNCRHTKTLATLACMKHALASLWDKPTEMFGKCHLSNVHSRCQRLDISSWKRVINQNQSEWKPSYFLGRVCLCWIHTIALHALCLQIPPQNAWTLPGILKITWLVIFKWYKPQNSLHYSYLFSWKYRFGSPKDYFGSSSTSNDFGRSLQEFQWLHCVTSWFTLLAALVQLLHQALDSIVLWKNYPNLTYIFIHSLKTNLKMAKQPFKDIYIYQYIP